MGKSDLIEKINARVKSQMSTLTARTTAKSKTEEKDDRGSDVAEKRITSRRGTVVVRRRGAARAKEAAPETKVAVPEAPLEAALAATPAEAATSDAEVSTANASATASGTVRRRASKKTATDEAAQETRASEETPVVEAENVEATAAFEAEAIEQAPDAPAAPEATATSAEESTEPPTPEEAIESASAEDAAEPTAPESTEPALEPAAEGPPHEGSAAAESRAPSIEEVLAKEHGRVPTLRRAVVIGQVERPVARPRPAGVRKATTTKAGARGATAAAQGEGAGSVRKDGTGPKTADARRKIPGKGERQPIGRPATLTEAEKQGKPTRARRGMRRKEVFQRRDGSMDTEPHFRKHRRVAVRRERAKTKLTTPKAIKRVIKIEDNIAVGELAHRMGVKASAVIKSLMPLGVMATINQAVDYDTASLVASEFGYEVANVAFDETALLAEADDKKEDMRRRPPVVTVMGHVDHGKTTLLDAIRDSDVASGEAGGITQHIGAHSVETEGGKIVFLDTPGHEAFTAMRARGAQVTDIVVLVVAADDGVMPRTVEAINHAKAAEVPIIVAINKIDKAGANPERVRQKLTEFDLVPEDWGGQTIYTEVSAKARINIKELLELILLQAEVLELEANPARAARATVVESQLDRGRGPVATVLVNSGTLKRGDIVVVGAQFGKVRAMVDDKGNSVEAAGPSIPVEILGLSGVAVAGDALAVVADLETAKTIAANRSEKAKRQGISKTSKATLEDLFSQMEKDEAKELKLILKTDVQGSLEALQKSIEELSTDKVKTNVLHTGVGAISEGDVILASASDAIVLGFNVKADSNAQSTAESEGVQIRTYSVIYEALDHLRLAMQGLLKPILNEKVLGHAEVRETFSIPKIGLIAGSAVTDGKIQRSSLARLLRDGEVLWEGKLASLRRFKDDVREVEKGYECGIGLEAFSDVRLGDVIEAYMLEEVRPAL